MTDRYYDPNDIRSFNITHVKLPIPGGSQALPRNDLINKFYTIVDDFTKDNPNKKVGVHCTHGFNRTGYFICSYLAEQRKMPIGDAIREFENQRRPGIYRQEFVDDLLSKFCSQDKIVVSSDLPWVKDNRKNYGPQTHSNRRYQNNDGYFYNNGGYRENNGRYHENNGRYHENIVPYENYVRYYENNGDYRQNNGGYRQNYGGYYQNNGGYYQNNGRYHENNGGYRPNNGGYIQDNYDYRNIRPSHSYRQEYRERISPYRSSYRPPRPDRDPPSYYRRY